MQEAVGRRLTPIRASTQSLWTEDIGDETTPHIPDTTSSERTGIATGHEEHRNVTAADGEGRDSDDIADDDSPPGHRKVEEALPCAICGGS